MQKFKKNSVIFLSVIHQLSFITKGFIASVRNLSFPCWAWGVHIARSCPLHRKQLKCGSWSPFLSCSFWSHLDQGWLPLYGMCLPMTTPIYLSSQGSGQTITKEDWWTWTQKLWSRRDVPQSEVLELSRVSYVSKSPPKPAYKLRPHGHNAALIPRFPRLPH